jgi:microfibrillar-associated protein 1
MYDCLLTRSVEEKEDDITEVDDTDGLDLAAEFEAWRLRELGRIKKEKEEELRREEEREEIERRRALPEEQRLKEDLERVKKLRDEKPKGQQRFLQKYWHKGAFHQVRVQLPFETFLTVGVMISG